MEDQILHADSTEEVVSDVNPFKKLLKKEQRLMARLEEEQEAEARAQERFQRAQTRLQRRRKRVERIQGKLVLVRELLDELHITDHQTVYMEHELVIATPPEAAPSVHSEEVTLAQPEQEATSIGINESDVLEVDGNEEQEQEYPTPQLDTLSPASVSSAPIEAIVESEVSSSSDTEAGYSNTTAPEHEAIQELEASSPTSIESTPSATNEQEAVATTDSIAVEPEVEIRDGIDISSDTNIERKPTKPLRVEQAALSAAESLFPDVQLAKEAWIAAESAMQNARNAAHGIATSIAFLSQNDGLSNEFMEELVLKQADANKELLKAQDVARAAYERFVQAQRDTESATRLPIDTSMNASEDHSQQKQENASLPPAEENGADQTAKLHAIRLYKEW